MLYHWFELGHAAFGPARVAADTCRMLLRNPFNPVSHTPMGRSALAAFEVFERTTRRYAKPSFDITQIEIAGAPVHVREEIVWQRPFCRLIKFCKVSAEPAQPDEPRILIVAPMSGHFASLLRGTVRSLLPHAEVFVTDWQDARAVPVSEGHFDLDDYIDYVREILVMLGGNVHVLAVCQPAVPVMAAVATLEREGNPAIPESMILMGGPIDTRINPTAVNELAESRGIDWFRRSVITTVPWPNAGRGRAVYPGFLQLTGFMTMNLDRHIKAHKDLFIHLVRGDGDSAERHKEFYDEYLAVMDLSAEFYLQTIDTVFIKHALAKGQMTYRGVGVATSDIRNVSLMTIEGQKDDITGAGQCEAAHRICTGLSPRQREHYVQAGVGHFGIFNGSRFREEILPRVLDFVRRNSRGAMRPRSAFRRHRPPGTTWATGQPSFDG